MTKVAFNRRRWLKRQHPKLQEALDRTEELGWVLEASGSGHVQLRDNFGRHVYSLPQTGSDWRGGLNGAAAVKRAILANGYPFESPQPSPAEKRERWLPPPDRGPIVNGEAQADESEEAPVAAPVRRAEEPQTNEEEPMARFSPTDAANRAASILARGRKIDTRTNGGAARTVSNMAIGLGAHETLGTCLRLSKQLGISSTKPKMCADIVEKYAAQHLADLVTEAEEAGL